VRLRKQMNTNLKVDGAKVIVFDGLSLVPRLVTANPSVPILLVTEDGISPVCGVCINIYQPSDVHFIESNKPYFFPDSKRIYGCQRTQCNQAKRAIHSSKDSAEHSSDSWSNDDDEDIPHEFIVIVR
jgi:hypothetical protein